MKKCFVPCCLNTTSTAPKKSFIFVPRNKDIRRSWSLAVGLQTHPPLGGIKHCCEDHFALKDDSIDYEFYKRTEKSPRIKAGVVPHLFLNAPNINTEHSQLKETVASATISDAEDVDPYFPDIGPSKREPVIPTLGTDWGYITQLSSTATSNHDRYVVGARSSSTSRGSAEVAVVARKNAFKELNRKRELQATEMHPRSYLERTTDVYCLVKFIYRQTYINERDIVIVLKRIRLNYSFVRLGLDFGLRTTYVAKIFTITVPEVEDIMRRFVFGPTKVVFKH